MDGGRDSDSDSDRLGGRNLQYYYYYRGGVGGTRPEAGREPRTRTVIMIGEPRGPGPGPSGPEPGRGPGGGPGRTRREPSGVLQVIIRVMMAYSISIMTRRRM